MQTLNAWADNTHMPLLLNQVNFYRASLNLPFVSSPTPGRILLGGRCEELMIFLIFFPSFLLWLPDLYSFWCFSLIHSRSAVEPGETFINSEAISPNPNSWFYYSSRIYCHEKVGSLSYLPTYFSAIYGLITYSLVLNFPGISPEVTEVTKRKAVDFLLKVAAFLFPHFT